MSAILMAYLFLAFSEPAYAQSARQVWLIGVGRNDEGRIDKAYFIDSTLIDATAHNIRRAWTWDYADSKYIGIALSEFDCTKRQRREIKSDLFDNKGKLVFPMRDTAWDYVTPGTIDEMSLDFVCSNPETWPSIAILVDPALTPDQAASRLFEPRQ